MPPSIAIFLIILGLLLFILLLNFHIHKPNEIAVVERFGKFHRLINKPGVYFLYPMIDRIVESYSTDPFFVSRKIKVQQGIPEPMLITYKIKVIDPMNYTYNSLDAVKMIHDYITQTIIAQMNRTEVFEDAKLYATQFGVELLYIEYNN